MSKKINGLKKAAAWLLAAALLGTSVNAGGLQTLAASGLEALHGSVADRIATPSNAPSGASADEIIASLHSEDPETGPVSGGPTTDVTVEFLPEAGTELLPGTGLEVPAAGTDLPVATASNFLPEFPAFEESHTVDGITVTVSAEEGAFPEGALLVVEKATEAQADMAEAAVAEQREAGKNVALSYTLDIHVEDEEGNELQPKDGKSVRVSFSTAAAADANLEAGVYHIREAAPKKSSASGLRKLSAKAAGSISMTAEKLDAELDEAAETVSVETDGFSLYTVEFTYNDLQYVMTGGTEIPLSVILEAVGLQGEISAVEVSDETLFSVEHKDDEWVILSHEPFSSQEWMKVTINSIVYEITVTDANVNTWAGLQAAFTAGNDVTLTGNVTAAASDERLSIPAGVNITLDLNGHTINRNRTAQESNGHVISLSGTLTLKDSVGGGTIKGGNNSSTQGGGIVVFNGGKLIMQGGTIRDNTASLVNTAGEGGGVCVMSGGTFTMSGGTIDSNTAGIGGGVYVASGGTFTMSGGTISNNHADRSTSLNSEGGGVFVAGTFTMNGGTITGNSAGTHGGGIKMYSDAVVTINKGTISNNTAGSSGGGISCTTNGTTNINGGSIINNNCGSVGGGINVFGTFNLKGAPNISGNKCGSNDSNLYAGVIHVVGALTNTTPIGVTTRTTPTFENGGVYFTNGLETPGNADYAKFKSDSERYYMGEYEADTGKEATLYPKYEIYMNCTSMEYFTPTTPYYQYVVPGSAMTETVFTANTNYGFSTGYSGTTVNGITAERISQTQVRVSGTPTGNNQRIEIPLYRALYLYTVSITAGSNMTKTSSSGAASQKVVNGDAITNIVYQAKSGYYFPDDYVLPSSYGISTAKNSTTQITVSGTLSSSRNVSITLGDASPISATAPTISGPTAVSMTYGDTGKTVSVTATAASGHTITGYQWYHNTTNSNTGGTAVSGATSASYSIPQKTTAGTHYYYCVVSTKRTDNGQTTTKASSAAAVTVAKRTATLSWSNTSLTYNRTSQKPTCTVSNLVSGDSCTVTVNGAQTNAGNNYTATASGLTGTSSANYQLPSANTTSFTINKKTVTLTWGNTTFTYNGNTQTPTATAGGVLSGDTCTVTVTGGQKNAGTHTATASGLTGTGSANYQLPSANTTSFTINKKTVTLTWDNTTFTYNGNTQTPTATAGGVLSGDTCTVTVTGGQKNAGTHTATASGLTGTGSGNYQLPGAKTTSFTIDPAPLTVTADAKSKDYGDTDPELTYTATGFKGTDTKASVMTGDLAREAGENVGDYAISQGTVSAGANYTISYTGANLTIGKATLTVKAVVKSKTYGDTDPALNYTATGFTNGDTLLVMSGKLERDTGENAGNYAIRQGTLSAGDNYTISYTGANFKIDPAPLTVTAEAKSKTYGDSDPELTYTADGFKNGDTVSVMSGDLAREAGEDAGDYAISQGTVTAGNNYAISYTGADLTIDSAPLTVAAEAKSKTYGDTDPELTYTTDGFKNGDTVSVMSGDLAREAGEDAGDYAISQGTVTAGNNYAISYTGADLTIDPAPLTVAAEAKSKTYGDTDPELTYTADGFKNGDTVSVMSGELAREAGEDAGDYAIGQGTVSAGANYTISYTSATFKIDPAPLTVAAEAKSKTYGDTDPELTYSADGFKNGDTESVMSGALERAVGENVGDYAIGQGTVTAGSNYTIGYTGAAFKIEPKEVGLSWPDTSFTYDGTAHIPAAEATGLVSGDTCEVTVSGSGTDAGSYTASASALSNGNYKLPEDVSVNFTVEAAAFSVTTPDAEKVYDGTPLTAEGTVTGLVNGETATFVTTGSQTEVGGSPNSYSLTWDGTAKESNYVLQSESLGTLTVTEYADEIMVTTVGGTFVYDGQPHGAMVEVSELPKGYTLVSAASDAAATDVTIGSGGAAGSIPATADTLVIQNASGTDVTDRLNITKADGSITITPAPYTVTTPDAEKVYDGTPLTAEGSISGLIGGETASLTAAGTQTEVGSSANTYSITWDGTAKKTNYAVESETLGTLTVTEYAGEITVTTTGGTFTYDGQPHGAAVEVSELPKGYTLVSAASDAAATDVTVGSDGTAASIPATADTLVIHNASGTDVTDRLNISKADGSITIEPAALTVATPDAEKVYDGTALTAAGNVSGLVNGETVTVKAAGSQKDAGSSSNTYSLVWDGTAKETNYKVTGETLGTLTVTPREVTISGITANNKTYDRSANIVLNYDSVVISGLVDGDSLTVSGTGTCDDAKIGKSKTVTISNLTLGGADAGNYKISSTGSQTTTTVDIEAARSGGGSAGSTHRKGYVGAVGGDWHQGGTNWTYTFGDGHFATGWNYLYYNGRSDWYYFRADDALMQTGWIDWEGNRYYLDPVSDGWKGSMFTGWHLIDGKWYYFETRAGMNQGRMYRNEYTPDGYWVGPDGVWNP